MAARWKPPFDTKKAVENIRYHPALIKAARLANESTVDSQLMLPFEGYATVRCPSDEESEQATMEEDDDYEYVTPFGLLKSVVIGVIDALTLGFISGCAGFIALSLMEHTGLTGLIRYWIGPL